MRLEDVGVVHEAVDGGQRHCGIGEDPVPFAERLVGGYHQRTPLVSRADQLEQNRGFSLILGDIGKVVEDQKVEAIKPIDRVLERALAARSEEHTSELPSLMRHSYAAFCLKKKKPI